jgi:hypothetical protein
MPEVYLKWLKCALGDYKVVKVFPRWTQVILEVPENRQTNGIKR